MVLRCEIPERKLRLNARCRWNGRAIAGFLPMKVLDISDGWNTLVLVTLKMVLLSKIPSRAMYGSVRRSRFVPMRLAEVPLESL